MEVVPNGGVVFRNQHCRQREGFVRLMRPSLRYVMPCAEMDVTMHPSRKAMRFEATGSRRDAASVLSFLPVYRVVDLARRDKDSHRRDNYPGPMPLKADLAELADWVEGLSAAAHKARDEGNITLAEALERTRFEVYQGYLEELHQQQSQTVDDQAANKINASRR